MEYSILGPIRVVDDEGHVIEITSKLERRLLALLLIHAGRPLAADRIIAALWGDRPPASGTKALGYHLSRLRDTLQPDRARSSGSVIETTPAGYRLVVDGSNLDSMRFSELVSEAQSIMVDDPARASHLLGDALAMWRGEPLSDLGSEPFAREDIRRLTNLKAAAEEARVAADRRLESGGSSEQPPTGSAPARRETLPQPGSSTEFRVLGPLEAFVDGAAADVTAPRQRELLALFLIHNGESLQRDRILEELWGDDQPADGKSALGFHIAKLRASLEPDRPKGDPGRFITTQSGAYRFEVPTAELDSARFEDLADQGRALVEEDPRRARELLLEALELWRGGALEEFVYAEFAQLAIEHLERRRLDALEDRIECDLALGAHAAVVPELEQLARSHVTRERFTAQLMISLYRSGRQTEALRAYEETRTALVDEYGLDPSPDLRDLEHAILVHASWLEGPAPAARRTDNLPTPATAFIDRQVDVAAVIEGLAQSRLVTLLGPGGVGKSRLALEVARDVVGDYRDGAWLVDLAPVTAAEDVVPRLIETLGIRDDGAKARERVLLDHLANRHVLMVLDTAEHVADEVHEVVTRLLAEAPELRLLVTSRQRLHAEGEGVWRVAPLEVPATDTAADVDASPAVAMFVDRARAVEHAFALDDESRPVVAEICRRLEGIPLAIELAAARLTSLSLGQITRRIEDRFHLLTASAAVGDRRHRTLIATLEWSYELLDANAQTLLARLGVFAQAFTVDDVEQVCSDERLPEPEILNVLERLIDASMVTRSGRVGSLRMLDTIHDFACEKLDEAGEETARLRRRHAEHFGELSAERYADFGRSSMRALQPDELANFRAAVDYALAAGDAEMALGLSVNLGRMWFMQGRHAEGRRVLEAVTGLSGMKPSEDLAMVLANLTMLALWSGEVQRADELAAEQEAVARDVGEPKGIARAVRLQATLAMLSGDFPQALSLAEQCIEMLRELDDPALANLLGPTAILYLIQGRGNDADRAVADLHDALDRYDFSAAEAVDIEISGWFDMQAGRAAEAKAKWLDAAEHYAAVDQQIAVVDALLLASLAALEMDDTAAAARLADRSLVMARRIPSAFFETRALVNVALADLSSGGEAGGDRLLLGALRRLERHRDHHWMIWGLPAHVAALRRAGRNGAAMQAFGVWLSLVESCGMVLPVTLLERGAELHESIRAELAAEDAEAALQRGLDQGVAALLS